MRVSSHARTLYVLMLAALLLTACSGPPAGEQAPLIDDAALDEAALDVLPAVDPVTPAGVRDAGVAAGDPAPRARLAPRAVLPEAEGVIVHTRHHPSADEPWAIVLFDLSTEESLEVYRGRREVQSVAIDGQDTVVLAARATTERSSNLEVFRADLQSGVVAQLTDTAADEGNVSSSTDGTLVAWEADHPDGGRRVIVWRDFADGSAHRLDSGDAQLQPSLTGDGQHLAFVHERPAGARTVSLFDLATHQLLEVHASTRPLRHPSASDAGEVVAWTEELADRDVARLWRSATGGVEDEFDELAGLRHLHLADSGRWLAYSAEDGSGWRLHTRDVQEDRTEPGPAGAGEDGAAYWRLSYDCTVTAAAPAANGAELRPTGLTCDSE